MDARADLSPSHSSGILHVAIVINRGLGIDLHGLAEQSNDRMKQRRLVPEPHTYGHLLDSRQEPVKQLSIFLQARRIGTVAEPQRPPGEYEFICSLRDRRQLGMRFDLADIMLIDS